MNQILRAVILIICTLGLAISVGYLVDGTTGIAVALAIAFLFIIVAQFVP